MWYIIKLNYSETPKNNYLTVDLLPLQTHLTFLKTQYGTFEEDLEEDSKE
jgi:hypothetical protein